MLLIQNRSNDEQTRMLSRRLRIKKGKEVSLEHINEKDYECRDHAGIADYMKLELLMVINPGSVIDEKVATFGEGIAITVRTKS